MVSKIIAFSGGCFSGKTTTIKYVKDVFNKDGLNCISLDEIIRNYSIESIDALRQDQSKYLQVQQHIIREKIAQEKECYNNKKNKVILIDRAISDSIFYLTHYVKFDSLTYKEKSMYLDLMNEVDDYAKFAFKKVYDCIVFLKPIENKDNNDIFRPGQIDVTKYVESKVIDLFNLGYTQDRFKYITFDLNKDDVSLVPQVLINYL